MSSAANTCLNCNSEFEKRKSGYKRQAINSQLFPDNYQWRNCTVKGALSVILRGATITPDVKTRGNKFVCVECFQLLQKSENGRNAREMFLLRTSQGGYMGAKRKSIRTPDTTPRKVKLAKVDVAVSPMPMMGYDSTHVQEKTRSQGVKRAKSYHTWKLRASNLLRSSRYKALFTTLLHQSFAAKKAFQDTVHKVVQEECQGYCLGERTLAKPVSLKTIQQFSWEVITKELSLHLPTLYTAVKSASNTCPRGTTKKTAGIGNLISSALYLRKRKKFKFVQALHAVSMWRSGCTHRLFDCLNHIGVSLGVKGARGTVDRLRKEFDSAILKWKLDIERQIPSISSSRPSAARSLAFDDMAHNRTEEVLPLSDESSLEMLDVDVDDDDDGVPPKTSGEGPGFTLCWDNVQIDSVARYQSTDRKNRVLLWALSFAVENRVKTTHLEDVHCPTIPASEIPLKSFLPTQQDEENLRARMTVMTARTLCKHFEMFKDGLGTVVPNHITHENSFHMQKKSNIVNLGVLETNPSSTAGTIHILSHLHQYIPERPDKVPYKTVCYGDGLSIERMGDAKRSRVTGKNNIERLEAFEPCPQEFHKRMLLMQDTMNELFSGRSAADRGTLMHVKNVFNRRGVKKEVKDAFNHVSEFLQFVTEGYICLFACHILGMTSEDDMASENFLVFASEDEKWAYMKSIANRIVTQIWHYIPKECLLDVLTPSSDHSAQREEPTLDTDEEEELDFPYCDCKEDTGEDMIQCSNTIHCKNGQWFHLSCGGIELLPDGDWYCSEVCQNTESSPYCYCKKNKPGVPMVRCHSQTKCRIGEWFHYDCVKLDADTVKGTGIWFCSLTCRKMHKSVTPTLPEDHVYRYSCAVLWRGLNDLVRRDAVREGDGEAMLSHWKFDMIEFWKYNHYKYLGFGHRFLSGVSGLLPPRISADMIWNRTANLRGGEGANIELDLVNEFLNHDFKENLKHARGRYTETHVARTAQIVGSLGKAVNKVYEQQVADTFSYHSTHSEKPSLVKEVRNFVKEYLDDKLTITVPGRQHSGFQGYHLSMEIQNPQKLSSQLKLYGTKLQNYNAILDKRKCLDN